MRKPVLLLCLCLCVSPFSTVPGAEKPWDYNRFREWQESIQRSAATDHSKQGEEWRNAEEKQMADRIMSYLDSRDGTPDDFRELFMLAETPRLKNELVARFLRRPWWADQFYDTADDEAQMKLFSAVNDVSSARICARVMQPVLSQEKLFPPSAEAPLARFLHHRWRYDMAEKFRAALAEKGQVVPPPDAADMPKDPATGEEVWARSRHNKKNHVPSEEPSPAQSPEPATPPAAAAAPAVAASRSWVLPFSALGVLAAGLLVWLRSRR